MKIERMNIADLKPAQYNPRKDLQSGDPEYEQLKKSITAFGYVDPIIVNKRNNIVIGGHQRLKILTELGNKAVDVSVVDLDEKEEKALNVALNKISGEWDMPMLQDILFELNTDGFDMESIGFSLEELQSFEFSEPDVPQEDDFDVEKALDEPAITQQGDIWLLGQHRLLCGDSTEEMTYDILLEGKKVNLVVTDPPYSVGYSAKAGTIKNDNLSDEDFYKFLLAFYQNTYKAMDNDASIYVFHSDTQGFNFRKAFREAGFYLSGVCVWAKQSLVLGRSPYQWRHEPILFGWKKNGKHKWYSDRKQSTVWEFDRPAKNDVHPTMKPIALCAYPIRNSSQSNGIVLDPFGGSGSTLIACEQIGRICYTMELEPKYADVIVKRYIEQVGNTEDIFLMRNGVKTKYADVQKGQITPS